MGEFLSLVKSLKVGCNTMKKMVSLASKRHQEPLGAFVWHLHKAWRKLPSAGGIMYLHTTKENHALAEPMTKTTSIAHKGGILNIQEKVWSTFREQHISLRRS